MSQLSEVITNKDHIPSKALLKKPYPENLPTLRICKPCNDGFAKDEEYLKFSLAAVLSGSFSPDPCLFPAQAKTLSSNNGLLSLLKKLERSYENKDGAKQFNLEPDVKRVENIVRKNATGHAFFELAEIGLGAPDKIEISPKPNVTDKWLADFESSKGEGELAGWPEVGSRYMERLVLGTQGSYDMQDGWINVQPDIYIDFLFAISMESRSSL